MTALSTKQKAAELQAIAEQIAKCRICKKDKIGVAVPGEGNPNADIVFIGEAPGKQEAKTGRPFIGPAGKMLRGLLAAIKLRDEDVFITSPVKYLPVYVTPKEFDIKHGRIHLFKQLGIIKPKIIVLMGNTACMAVLGEKFPIAKVHGTIIQRERKSYFISYHPAAPLYSPSLRPVLKKDFFKLKKLITAN